MLMAQTTSGDLVGSVVDKSGAVVGNANVEAVNQDTNVKSTTTTNASGEYRFNNLLPGTYVVTATAPNMAPSSIRVPVELNKTANAKLTLGVAATTTTVEVTDTAAAVDTTTDQLQTTYDIKQNQTLPTATQGLGVLNLSLLQAGVSQATGLGAGTGPSVGGQRPRNNNFTVEGIDNNDKTVTGPIVQIPNDAVGEFTILQNQFNPEFGHSNGGQFNQAVISGTNTFHGRLYEYFQNRNLNAMDVSAKNNNLTENPRFDDNRYGGQIGGPIIKNKLFFFANYEREPIGSAAPPQTPPLGITPAGFATLATIPGISQTNLNLLKEFATASTSNGTPITVGGQSVDVGVLTLSPALWQNNQRLVTSMDYNLSDSDQIRGRYIYNKQVAIDNAAELPQFFSTVPQFAHLFALTEYHTFSPRVQNEFRLGFNRNGNNFTVPSRTFANLGVFPNITLDNLGGLNIGPDPNAPQFATNNMYQAVDNVSWTHGNHTLKFGGEARKYIAPQLFVQRSRGDYEFSDVADFLFDNIPDFGQRSVGGGYSGDQYAIYGYGNDIWKVRPNLTLNLGLRYEFTSTPFGWTQQSLNSIADVPGLITFGSPKAPKKDFMPRVGFAYSPGNNQNTSIRGGFSMGYDVLYDNIGTLSRPPELGAATLNCSLTDTTNCPSSSGFFASGALPGTAVASSLSPADARAITSSFLPNNVQYPYSMSWNLGVQHQFANKYTAEIRYVGTRGVHLNVQSIINLQPIVTATQNLPTFLSQPSAATVAGLTTTLADLENLDNEVPAFEAAGFGSAITGFLPLGSSTYHGLQTQLNRSFSNGLQFQAAYTWSHTIDNSTADFFSTVLTPRRPQDFQCLSCDRSNSALDRRHRLTLQLLYEVPFFKHSNSFMKNVVGNWTITPVYTFESGEWADVQSAVDSNLNGDSAPDRSIINPGGIPGTGSGVSAICNSGFVPSPTVQTCGDQGSEKFVVGYVANNPSAQYIAAGLGAFANAGRNTLQMDPINNIDLSVFKRLNLTERYQFEFGAQAFNVLNHSQFVAGSINTVNGNLGFAPSAHSNYLQPGTAEFNQPQTTFLSHSRQMQLSMKFIF
jgi:hypothetical protein